MRHKLSKTWFVIADGARYKIFESMSPVDGFEIVSLGEQDLPRDRDIATDRPGHGRTSGTGQHYSLENKVDFHEQAEEEFISKLAAWLDRDETHSKFDRLVLVAPPRAMGILRPKLSRKVQNKVHEYLTKDMTNLPDDKLFALLEDNVEPW